MLSGFCGGGGGLKGSNEEEEGGRRKRERARMRDETERGVEEEKR